MSSGVPSSPHEKLEELARKYARVVRAAVRKVGGVSSERVVDEVEQRVYLELWKQVSREHEIRHPASYVYRAAVRETVRVLREDRRLQTTEVGESESDTRTPEDVLESKQLGAQIREVIELLPTDRRRAVRAHLAGYKIDEIMTMYGWPYHKARNLIARGIAVLRRGLKERGLHD